MPYYGSLEPRLAILFLSPIVFWLFVFNSGSRDLFLRLYVTSKWYRKIYCLICALLSILTGFIMPAAVFLGILGVI